MICQGACGACGTNCARARANKLECDLAALREAALTVCAAEERIGGRTRSVSRLREVLLMLDVDRDEDHVKLWPVPNEGEPQGFRCRCGMQLSDLRSAKATDHT